MPFKVLNIFTTDSIRYCGLFYVKYKYIHYWLSTLSSECSGCIGTRELAVDNK